MKAITLHEHGGPDTLQLEEIDRPEPARNELLIEVEAAGVNPVDTYFREGSYTPVGLPFTPGVDFAGTVEAVGTEVDSFEPGDPVFGTGIGNSSYQGAYAEYAVVPIDRTVHRPDGVDPVTAGGAGVVAATAWRALIEHAELRPAETVLVHGGSGGVGHAAIQLAAASGARVLATASPAYHEHLRSLGADVVFDYAREDLATAVREASDGGVSVILDHRLDDYLQFDASVAAAGGRIVGIGENDRKVSFTDVTAVRSKDLSYTFMSLFNTPNLLVALRAIAQFLSEGDLDIHVADFFDLADAPDAHRAVMTDSFLGKLVIQP